MNEETQNLLDSVTTKQNPSYSTSLGLNFPLCNEIICTSLPTYILCVHSIYCISLVEELLVGIHEWILEVQKSLKLKATLFTYHQCVLPSEIQSLYQIIIVMEFF